MQQQQPTTGTLLTAVPTGSSSGIGSGRGNTTSTTVIASYIPAGNHHKNSLGDAAAADDFFDGMDFGDQSPMVPKTAAPSRSGGVSTTTGATTTHSTLSAVLSAANAVAGSGVVMMVQQPPTTCTASAAIMPMMGSGVPLSNSNTTTTDNNNGAPNNDVANYDGGNRTTNASSSRRSWGRGNNGDDEEDGPTDNMSREFYRREVLRATTLMLLVATICFFRVPIIAFMVLPVGSGVVYWLRNTGRFVSGGDQTRCFLFNRNGCIHFYMIVLFATIAICLVDVVVLMGSVMGAGGSAATAASSSGNAGVGRRIGDSGAAMSPQDRTVEKPFTAPSPKWVKDGDVSHDAAYHAAHKTLLFFDLVLNAVCGLVAVYSLYVCRKLQALLE